MQWSWIQESCPCTDLSPLHSVWSLWFPASTLWIRHQNNLCPHHSLALAQKVVSLSPVNGINKKTGYKPSLEIQPAAADPSQCLQNMDAASHWQLHLQCQASHLDPTGWSKETVDCNISLTEPKKSKTAQTLYWEVLVFWYPICLRCKLFFRFRVETK